MFIGELDLHHHHFYENITQLYETKVTTYVEMWLWRDMCVLQHDVVQPVVHVEQLPAASQGPPLQLPVHVPRPSALAQLQLQPFARSEPHRSTPGRAEHTPGRIPCLARHLGHPWHRHRYRL